MTGSENPAADRPLVRFRVTDGIATLLLAHPPVNALDTELRSALASRLDAISKRDDVVAVVLMAEGPSFSDDTAVEEIARPVPRDVPSFAALCRVIEELPVPVVAVLQGPASGSGAELAIACDVRLSTPGARIGFPAIGLGLPPSAGATQILPRLVGVEAALRLLLTGRAVAAPLAQKIGLVEGIIQGDSPSAGISFARRLVEDQSFPDPIRTRRGKLVDGSAALAAIAAAREALGPDGLFAAHRITDCVEAAVLMPFDVGLAVEAEAFCECRDHAESRAMRSLVLAERRISSRLLVLDESGHRRPRPDGQAVIDALIAAQDRAIGWLCSQGVSEAAVDAAFLRRGFARGPFGGTAPQVSEDVTVWPRVRGALLAEGGRQMTRGAVRAAGDIDALAVHGMRWPRRLGGPMIAAQIAGLAAQVRDLKSWTHDDRIWAPSPPVIDASKIAAGFAD